MRLVLRIRHVVCYFALLLGMLPENLTSMILLGNSIRFDISLKATSMSCLSLKFIGP